MAFYTYQYQRSDGTVYYVGKGNGDRALSKQRNAGVPVKARILIQHCASEDEAYEMEKWWISFWGRKDNGTGILRNLTDGGVGYGTGAKRSKETLQKMREAKLGNKYSTGWVKGKPRGPMSETHRQKISGARIGQTGNNPFGCKGKRGI
jgi:hypothetical protein